MDNERKLSLSLGAAVLIKKMTSPLFSVETRDIFIKLLEFHGATITSYPHYCEIMLPESTTKREIFPRCLDIRYQIVFPDGFTLLGVEIRGHRESIVLYFPSDDIPEVQVLPKH